MVKDIPWRQIRRDYEAGVTYRQLAEQYGVPTSTLGRRGRAEGWRRRDPDWLERYVEEVAARLLTAAEELLHSPQPLTLRELKDLTALLRELDSLRQTVRQQDSAADEQVRVVLEGELARWGE